MSSRSATAFAALALTVVAASPSLAQSVDPAMVLAAKGHPGHGRGFADRTARLTSIMGAEASTAAPLRLPTKPAWTHPVRREADAAAALR